MFRLRLQNLANSKNQLSPTAYRGQKSMTDDVESSQERARSVTSFYYQNAIDVAAAKVICSAIYSFINTLSETV